MSCKAKTLGIVKKKGNKSIEWHKDGVPQFYCMGYVDASTEALLDVCKECRENVIHSQKELEEYQSNKLKESEE